MLMIGILLAVLKTLLFLILLLFCLILLLLLLLLLSPFSYRFEATRSKEGENRAHFSVRFLFGLFRFWADYERELSFQAKLFLFTLLDSGGESREESRSETPRPGSAEKKCGAASDVPRPSEEELRPGFSPGESEERAEKEIEPPPAPDDPGQEGEEAGERTRGPAAGEKESSRDGLKRLRLLLLEGSAP